MEPLILASQSPRRRALLLGVGIAVDVRPAAVDERAYPGENAIAYACRLAAAKADAVVASAPGRWVLAADTIVEVDGELLGKAAHERAARAMLSRLVGRSHRVTTAFSLRGPGSFCRDRAVTTEVLMRSVSPREIGEYVAAGEWRGKAGAYAVQGMAAALVREVRGSITNVIGLPLAEVVEELAAAGAARPSYQRGVPA